MLLVYCDVLSQNSNPPSGLLYGGKSFKYKDKVRRANANEKLENRHDCIQKGYTQNCTCLNRSNWKTLRFLKNWCKKTLVLQQRLQIYQSRP